MSTSFSSVGFLRLPQVLSIIPVSKSTWWEGCKTGRFPKPVKIGPRTTVWRTSDIYEFIDKAGNDYDIKHDWRER